ncbi:ABC transporter ATP-binding protein [Corynebacterium qintianiae]|uniref:ABC transporter ATP-binding protein n=1 Tax=Corynebacterium qintianiae TaxID=2709392 RepID=UPI0013EB034A|nr:ABC transporter ATP-binding protein [Corynebacterium qintianiae]
MSNITVAVRRVSKYYRTKYQPKSKVRGVFSRTTRDVMALDDVSLLARSGESIGVLGQNGSGKSTLLRIIGGQEAPSKGEVLVRSTPSLLGVSAALQPHLTGVENIRLGCLAKGMDPSQLNAAVEEIAEFCDIGDAIYRPMKTYSSGMGARLRFGIATTMRPEILLVDEALSTGDAAFNARASQRMSEFLERSGTIFVVSHVAKSISDLCERSIWIHEGEIISDGPTSEISELYDDWIRHKSEGKDEGAAAIVSRVRSDFVPTEIFPR